MCTEKRKGGIGIKSFSKMNKALLCKWNWRFATTEIRFGEKLFAVSLVSLLMAGIPATSEADMGLAYERKLGKTGPVFSKMWSSP